MSSCPWRIDISKSRLHNPDRDILSVVGTSLKHGLTCLIGTPSPSLDYFLRQRPVANFAMANKPKDVIAYVKTFGFDMSTSTASRLKEKASASPGSEQALGYQAIRPWLEKYVELNPGAVMRYKENVTTGSFESCALLFPAAPLLKHSFLRTFMVNGGFIETPDGVKAQLFVLTVGDREHRSVPIAIGIYDVESIENYSDFFGMLEENEEIWKLLLSIVVGVMHDRHLSFLQAVLACFPPKTLNRIDVIHLVRNIKVRFFYVVVIGTRRFATSHSQVLTLYTFSTTFRSTAASKPMSPMSLVRHSPRHGQSTRSAGLLCQPKYKGTSRAERSRWRPGARTLPKNWDYRSMGRRPATVLKARCGARTFSKLA